LSSAEGKELIDQVAGFDRPYPILVLTGGDCLLREDIFELVDYAKGFGIPVALSPSVTPILDAEMVQKIVERALCNVISSLSRFKSIDIFLVESDSFDKTHEVLKKLKSSISFLNFVNLGVLKPTIPDRIERIRYSRNIYVNYICDS
jgi:MoaA/NifB/PqqE/SkfB family radical SAM enzyme